MKTNIFTVGLTGGIGSGKTTASRLFAARGASIIDSDLIAHRLTGSNGLAMPSIASYFGVSYVTDNGSLNRARMRELIFRDTFAKQQLETIMHPLIRKEMERESVAVKGSYLVLVIPLLVKASSLKTSVTRVLSIDCNIETQISRVIRRNHFMREQVEKIISQQVSREEYVSIGNDLITNDEDILEKLDAQVNVLHQRYIRLASIKTIK